ncbi:MAG TPA: metal-dependent hydrolase [Pyrinomonadaceae bacterium]|nr:metal-dependent hydrolase [Pyrinomonadaceae bacterium]
MDNLTHSLVGLAAAKAGLEKLSPGATALCVLAANSPDADIVTLAGGRWAYLQNHRGLTHSIIGTLVLAIALPLVFHGVAWLIARLRQRRPTTRLAGLMVASILVTATHPLLDWTNNYGVRLLLPWNSRWFYGDSVFIMDPVFWLVLGGAAFLVASRTRIQRAAWIGITAIPTLLVFFGPVGRGGLANALPLRIIWIGALVGLVVLYTREVGQRWGAKIPRVALLMIVAYVAGLIAVHAFALQRLSAVATELTKSTNEHPVALAAMPTLANPLRWICVVETEASAYRFELGLTGAPQPARLVRYQKPNAFSSPLVAKAEGDYRAKVFLGFARFPVLQVADPNCTTQTLVQFADLRYTEPGSTGTFSLEVPVECDVTLETVR